MTDGLRKSHLRKAPQVGLSEVGLPEGNLTRMHQSNTSICSFLGKNDSAKLKYLDHNL